MGPAAGSTPAGSAAVRAAGVAVLVLAATVPFLPSLGGPPIWDDNLMVTENPLLLSSAGLAKIWTQPFASFQYYPLTFTSLWIERALFGPNFQVHRVVNLLLHAGAVLLAWRALRRLDPRVGWFAALVAAVHPLGVESVAWVAERKNVLAAVFFWAAALVLLRDVLPGRGGSPRLRTLLAAALFVCALLAKTAAVVLLPLLFVVLIWSGRLGRRSALVLLALAAVALPFLALTARVEHAMLGTADPLPDPGFAGRLDAAGRALWFYLAKALWPAGLAQVYPRFESGVLGLLAGAAYAVLAVVALRAARPSLRAAGAVLATMAVGVAPVLGLIGFGYLHYAPVADRFTYFALPFVAFFAVSAAAALLPDRRARLVLAVASASVLAVISWQRAGVYASEERFWRDAMERNPSATIARLELGTAYLRQGATDAALAEIEAARRVAPDDPLVLNRYGVALAAAGRWTEARRAYEAVLARNPGNLAAASDYGVLLSDLGEHDAAIRQLDRARTLVFRRGLVLVNLANAHLRAGNHARAEAVFVEAEAAHPGLGGTSLGMGALRLEQRRLTEAVEFLHEALRRDPSLAGAHFNLGIVRTLQGRPQEAAESYRAALRLEPRHAGARNNLAVLLFELGDRAGARREVESGRAYGVAFSPGFLAALGAAD